MSKNRIYRRGMGLVLSAVMLLTGCGTGAGKSVSLYSGKLTDSSVVMTVGSEGVPFSEIKDYCYFLKCQYEGSFGDQLWNYSISKEEKGTIGEQAKQEIINMITQVKIICTQADKQEVTLTTDEIDEANQKAETMFEEASETDRSEYALSAQELSRIYQENALANKMFYIATDAADTNVTDAEAQQIQIQYMEVMTEGTDRNGTIISMDNKTKKQALIRARDLCKQAKKTDDFLSLAQNNSDASQVELTIGKDFQDLEQTVVDAAFEMKTGQTSGVIEGEQGYYIMYCVSDYDEDATYREKEAVIKQRQTDMFVDKYAQWLKDQKVNISDDFWNEFSI